MKPRRQTLENLTFVTIGSLAAPGPMNPLDPVSQSPLATLSVGGVEETHELRREFLLFEAPPFDCIFVAAPFYMLPAVAEMSIILTGAEGTGYAELPFTGFPLTENEAIRIHHILSLEPASSLGQVVLHDLTNADFLYSYARHRHERILVDAGKEHAKHGIVFGLPILIQAIALTFAKTREEKRRIENIVPVNGHALQIDVASGSLRIPSEAKLARLAYYS